MQSITLPNLRSSLVITMIGFLINSSNLAPDYVDDTAQAHAYLTEQRAEVQVTLKQDVTAAQLNRLVSLGLWETALRYLDEADTLGASLKLVEARLWMKKHRYFRAEKNVREVLALSPENREATLLRAKLYIQSWELSKAIENADALLAKNGKDAAAGMIRGRVSLLAASTKKPWNGPDAYSNGTRSMLKPICLKRTFISGIKIRMKPSQPWYVH